MNKIKCFAHDSITSPEEVQIITNCLSLVREDLSFSYVSKVSLETVIQNNMIIIVFGKTVKNTVNNFLKNSNLFNIYLIDLPLPKKLTKTQENLLARKESFKKLQQAKDLLETDSFQQEGLVIKEEDLPQLKKEETLLLKQLADSDITFQVNKSGEVIEIGKESTGIGSLFVTWKELFAVRTIMDTLGVKQVKITKRDKNV